MNRLKQNRAASFVTVALIYIIAGVAGFYVYNALNFEWWLNLLIADAFATVLTFAFSVILGNASVYDPYWSVQSIVILSAFAVGQAVTPLRLLLMIAVAFWGIRLTANWAYTFKNLTYQDWRYTMLHDKTGAFYPIVNFTGIHMVPTLIVYACTLPAAYAFLFDTEFKLWSAVFVAVSLGAAIMQGVADYEMHRYRKVKDTPFVREGLWKYSRHPNYLGEILMWWGVALAVVVSFPRVWYLILGAVLNTILFLSVSIPMADKRQSEKRGFSEYKRETRMLLPIKK